MSAPPRLTYLRIRNYRALRDVEFRDLTPLTVLIGANGSGKSTVLDALVFWAECVRGRTAEAWGTRNGATGLQAEGTDQPINIELKLTDARFQNGEAVFALSAKPEGDEGQTAIDLTLVNAEQLTNQTSDGNQLWHLVSAARHIHFTDSHTAGFPDAIQQRHLSPTGDNLPNVLFYLKKKHPELLEQLLAELRRRVPRLESITAEETIDKRLVLRLKDEAFAEPIPARFASDGTLRLLAYLVLLNEPEPAGLLGVEEPEAEIHPSLHGRLAEDFIRASARTQIFVATHSPQFLNALDAEQVWVLDRTPDGYTRATRAADIIGVQEMMNNGGALGELWLEGYLNPDDRRPAAPPMHVEFLLEEASAEQLLAALLPTLFEPLGATFRLRPLRGKQTLLKELPKRLHGYRDQLHARPDLRVVVLTDRDHDDCRALKQQLETFAHAAGLPTKARPTTTGTFVVVTRIACEELEAWLLGDPAAVCQAYPRVKHHHFKAAFTHTADPDAIRGGTAEALERVFVAAHYPAGKLKVEWAERIAPHLDPARNQSASFRCFWHGVQALLAQPT